MITKDERPLRNWTSNMGEVMDDKDDNIITGVCQSYHSTIWLYSCNA